MASSETPQHPLPYSSCSNKGGNTDSIVGDSSEAYITQPRLDEKEYIHRPAGLSSPSKRRRASKGSSSSGNPPRPNRKSSGTPTPCCTPTNSPEKYRNTNSSPQRSHSRNRRSRPGYQRLRAPGSPPTPYATTAARGSMAGGETADLQYGISKLKLDMVDGDKQSLDFAATPTTFGSRASYDDDEYEMEAEDGVGIRGGGSPRFFGSLEERQRRYRELNEVRIRNWERFYGDMDGQREGGGVRCKSALGDKMENLQDSKEMEEEEEGGDNGKGKPAAVPVKFSFA